MYGRALGGVLDERLRLGGASVYFLRSTYDAMAATSEFVSFP